jgi:hypothetical protein
LICAIEKRNLLMLNCKNFYSSITKLLTRVLFTYSLSNRCRITICILLAGFLRGFLLGFSKIVKDGDGSSALHPADDRRFLVFVSNQSYYLILVCFGTLISGCPKLVLSSFSHFLACVCRSGENKHVFQTVVVASTNYNNFCVVDGCDCGKNSWG